MNFHIETTKNRELTELIQRKIDTRTKPLGALGMLEKIALKVSLIQKTDAPEIKKPSMLVFAGDHGIADEGVSAFPKEVTAQMVFNFLNGGAAVNVFAKQNGFNLRIIDSGVDYDFKNISGLVNKKIAFGTKNFLKSPAMTDVQCELALKTGAELVAEVYGNGSNFIAFGEMGIGNTSSATLIMSKILGLPISECTGRGTGLNDDELSEKTEILQKALRRHPEVASPMEVLQYFGGFEIAMTVGAALKAAELKMTILVDGFIISSAILLASKLYPNLQDYLLFAHLSDEFAHGKMISALNGTPILRLNMRLGEGSGAAVALPIVSSSLNFLTKMASFEDAAVSGKTS